MADAGDSGGVAGYDGLDRGDELRALLHEGGAEVPVVEHLHLAGGVAEVGELVADGQAVRAGDGGDLRDHADLREEQLGLVDVTLDGEGVWWLVVDVDRHE